jgi:hypothetical protein
LSNEQFNFTSFINYLWTNDYVGQNHYLVPSGTINNGEWTPTKLYLANLSADYFMTLAQNSQLMTTYHSWYSSGVSVTDTIS